MIHFYANFSVFQSTYGMSIDSSLLRSLRIDNKDCVIATEPIAQNTVLAVLNQVLVKFHNLLFFHTKFEYLVD